jgi:6-methylsalicylate decarboxylase
VVAGRDASCPVRLDLHLHFSPPEYHARLQRHPVGAAVPSWSFDAMEAAMAKYRVDKAVISAASGVFFGDQAEANELARMINEAAAAIVRDDPGRFGALATLPLPDPDAAIAELDYAFDTLGLDGVILLSSSNGAYLGNQAFRPLFDELERRRAYVFVHPAVPPWLPAYEHPLWVLELPFESTRAALDLVFSGTLDRCPNVRFQLSHLGGTVPFLAHRMASMVGRDPALAARLHTEPLSYFARFFYDTALALNPPAFAATLALIPPEQIVFGTDWPYLPEEELEFEPEPLHLSDDTIAAIESRNAAALVSRLT